MTGITKLVWATNYSWFYQSAYLTMPSFCIVFCLGKM